MELQDTSFEKSYLSIREKEHRVYSDDEVKVLPKVSKSNDQYKEWKQRASTAKRFFNYLSSKKQALSILEIGCGNGWFSNYLSTLEQSTVLGIDINNQELEQAARVFHKKNLNFRSQNITENTDNIPPVDIIVFNASIQYFEDLALLFSTLKKCLKSKGEVHILDSPFYKTEDVSAAKKRSQEYYENAGYAEMNNYYFHHCWEDLPNYEVIYHPRYNRVKQLFGYYNTPFSWLAIKK